MKKALFPGTFSPFTIGHADIVSRALCIFDRVIICLGVNHEKTGTLADAEARLKAIAGIYASNPYVEVIARQGLTIDVVKETGADAILRGVRSVKDYEYERDMADANRALAGVETIILVARPELAFISSSLVNELKSYGRDVSRFIPE